MTVQKLEEWFVGCELPRKSEWVHKFTKIIDSKSFVEGRLYSIHANPGPRHQQPCIDKLVEFKIWMEENGY